MKKEMSESQIANILLSKKDKNDGKTISQECSSDFFTGKIEIDKTQNIFSCKKWEICAESEAKYLNDTRMMFLHEGKIYILWRVEFDTSAVVEISENGEAKICVKLNNFVPSSISFLENEGFIFQGQLSSQNGSQISIYDKNFEMWWNYRFVGENICQAEFDKNEKSIYVMTKSLSRGSIIISIYKFSIAGELQWARKLPSVRPNRNAKLIIENHFISIFYANRRVRFSFLGEIVEDKIYDMFFSKIEKLSSDVIVIASHLRPSKNVVDKYQCELCICPPTEIAVLKENNVVQKMISSSSEIVDFWVVNSRILVLTYSNCWNLECYTESGAAVWNIPLKSKLSCRPIAINHEFFCISTAPIDSHSKGQMSSHILIASVKDLQIEPVEIENHAFCTCVWDMANTEKILLY